MSLKNKVAIVTGGNSGIGQAIVLELARQEASIVIDYVVHTLRRLRRSSGRPASSVLGLSASMLM
jgi:NAD(P)-dependent dehydrogenase (short-subunit alcohol dehydrogenase family)